jgi:hypothetical protein
MWCTKSYWHGYEANVKQISVEMLLSKIKKSIGNSAIEKI